ncbi:MAG: asparagine synthase (glutamine-hydrolyzing) [Acidobacteria bacterium]|nr:MAG: asparagine synthase (glutamine-hydrolyzing) [Acidobacteriota bacterium]
MCGISVVVAPSSLPEATQDVLRMHAPIRHRGPDGEGILLSDAGRVSRFSEAASVPAGAKASVAFAFRRLKIVDLTDAAAQPMSSGDGERWLMFNGEIYNFRSLRSELTTHGHTFRTSGDTEVILAAYEEWGEECFSRFEGMWAIVILDLRNKRLVACRDRFGIKPLYYRKEADRLLLASEIRQILAVTGRAQANPDLVCAFLLGDRDTVLDDTFFDGIHLLPPGSWFSVSLESTSPRMEMHQFWNLDDFRESEESADYATAVDRVGQLMAEAVRSHSVADVPLGSLLSGGLDSSTIATLLVREKKNAPTFSFGFRDMAPQFCELSYVDALVRAEGMANHETTFSPDWVANHADRIVTALEEPPLAMPALAQFRTFELCHQHGTTVVLDGQGSDEIFAGYPYHERLLLIERLRHVRFVSFAREASRIAKRESLSVPSVVAKAFVMPPLYGIAQKMRGRTAWISSDYGTRNGTRDQSHTINDRLHHDVKWGNVKIILGYADKNAMHFSIEARVPYFDRQLVEFAFSLPADFKVGCATRKRVLRDFARTLLPREITERRDRMGFATPDAVWLRTSLWPRVREAISDSSLLSSACFDAPRLRRFVGEFERGEHRDHRAIWRLWMFSIWKNAFSVAI